MEMQSKGAYSDEIMQDIKDQTSQAEALTLSLARLKHIGAGETLGHSFADGSLVETCKSSMRMLVEDTFKNVTVGDLLAWGHRG